MVTVVKPHSIAGHQFPHHAGYANFTGTYQEMEMVGKEAPGETLAAVKFEGDFQAVYKIQIVNFFLEYIPAFDSAGHDVVKHSGQIKPSLAWHEQILMI